MRQRFGPWEFDKNIDYGFLRDSINKHYSSYLRGSMAPGISPGSFCGRWRFGDNERSELHCPETEWEDGEE